MSSASYTPEPENSNGDGEPDIEFEALIKRLNKPKRSGSEAPIPPIPPIPPAVFISPSKRSPKSIWQLPCHTLSKKTCGKEPFRCTYNEEKKVCAPSKTSWGERYAVQWFGSRQLWRTNIFGLLDQIENGCNVGSYAENVKVFASKASASQSIIISGTIQPTAIDKTRSPDNNVIFKITYDPIDPLDNSLQVEIAIYKNIITRLVNNRNTPHVTSFLGFQTCKSALILPPGQVKLFNAQLKKLSENEAGNKKNMYDLTRANLLLTERSSGMELKFWITNTTPLRDLLAIIFQVLYTLNCFARIGLQHNDLHYGNIFVEDMGQPVTLFYKRSPHQYVELTTRYLVKIYDWDRGSILHPAVPTNLELTAYFCMDYGTCEFYSPKFDYFQFIAVLHQYTELEPSVKKEIKSWILKILDWKWYTSLFSREISHRLQYLELPTDEQLKPVKDALKLFIEHNWTNAPFIIRSGTGDELPPEIFFHPPEKLTRVFETWYPTSNEAHENRTIEEKRYVAYNDRTIETAKIWIDEWKKDGVNIVRDYSGKLMKELGQKTGKNYTISDNESRAHEEACFWLCLYKFHRLNSREQKAVVSKPLISDIIDNIWNVFDNRLPIAIPKYSMKNLHSEI
jgi:hypothetical protein